MEISTQQHIAKELIEKLELICPDVMIAGGAVSDWCRGVKARDLDVYINIPNGELNSHLANDWYIQKKLIPYLSTGVGWLRAVSLTKACGGAYYQGVNGIKDVYSVEYKGMPVEIIVCGIPVRDMYRNFDADICRAYMARRGITILPECKQAIANKVINVQRNTRTTEKLYQRRLKKLRNKYKDYEIKEVKSLDPFDDIPF